MGFRSSGPDLKFLILSNFSALAVKRLLVAFPSKSATAVPASELAVCHAKLSSGYVDLQVGHEYLTGRESKALQFKLCAARVLQARFLGCIMRLANSGSLA